MERDVALPLVLNTGNIEKFLKHIQTAKVPSKLGSAYLEQAGFKGRNDRYLTAFMKNLGFTDNAGVPTQRWHDHRHTSLAGAIRAQAIEEAWAGYFGMYPDAQNRSDEDFRNWARGADPKASEVTVNRSLATFKAIVKLADFDAAAPSSTSQRAGVAPSNLSQPPAPVAPLQPSGGVQLGAVGGITINIELQIPATADAKFFDQFFSSMRKNLIDDEDA